MLDGAPDIVYLFKFKGFDIIVKPMAYFHIGGENIVGGCALFRFSGIHLKVRRKSGHASCLCIDIDSFLQVVALEIKIGGESNFI